MPKDRISFALKHLPNTGRVLDIGNLNKKGDVHKKLQKYLPQVEWHGLDVVAQKETGTFFVNQRVGSCEDIPFPGSFFEAIYMGQVFEHTWLPKKTLEECSRVLVPGGRLILDMPNVYSLARILRYLCKGQDVILGDPDHKIFYSRSMIENLLVKSGFSVSKIISDGVFPIKGRMCNLPAWGSLEYLGDHLLVAALKNTK